ncbi:MAG: nucleotide exchange factor GrpE [Verrucomicrobiae bacterium]|nr:nucleotide exchange factor GrpE [Verrucomicrobiae bacterium]
MSEDSKAADSKLTEHPSTAKNFSPLTINLDDIEVEAISEHGVPIVETPKKEEAPVHKEKTVEPKEVIEKQTVPKINPQEIEKIHEKLDVLIKGIGASAENATKLNQKFDEKIASEGHSQNLFSALHKELASYKDNMLLDIFHKPVIKDMIFIHDDLARMEKSLGELKKSLPEGSELVKSFENSVQNAHNMRAFVLEVLARLDVELMAETPRVLDKAFHKPLKTLPTQDQAQDGRIAETLNPGFTWKGRTFRAEEVVIFKFEIPK